VSASLFEDFSPRVCAGLFSLGNINVLEEEPIQPVELAGPENSRLKKPGLF
jgi:hypothetical protein